MITEEDKKLLLRDLCARQPYGVKCYAASYKQPYTLIGIVEDEIFLNTPIHDEGDGKFDLGHEIIKPYLRPMSYLAKMWGGLNEEEIKNPFILFHSPLYALDYFLENHIDFRGLIEKGLALEAPEDMYKTE